MRKWIMMMKTIHLNNLDNKFLKKIQYHNNLIQIVIMAMILTIPMKQINHKNQIKKLLMIMKILITQMTLKIELNIMIINF